MSEYGRYSRLFQRRNVADTRDGSEEEQKRERKFLLCLLVIVIFSLLLSMLLVREIFTCKPGQASKFVKLMKEVSTPEELGKTRIMTDLVGPYNTVVMETEVADLQEWQKMGEHIKG